MRTAPVKPVEDMTEEELRQWKAWLLYEGMHPRPMKVDRPKNGSVYEYDSELHAVVETTLGGTRYVIEIHDNQLRRCRELSRPSTAQS